MRTDNKDIIAVDGNEVDATDIANSIVTGGFKDATKVNLPKE